MKKGIIVSVEGDKLIILTECGKFIKHKNKNNEIGENVSLGLSKRMKYALVSAFMVAFFVIGGTSYAGISIYNKPVSYISIDINPSVEFTLNSSGKVLSVAGTNDDGNVLISNEDFSFMKIEDATAKIIDLAARSGYFYLPPLVSSYNTDSFMPEKNFNALMVTVVDDNGDTIESLKEKTILSVAKYFSKKEIFCLILSRDGNYNNQIEAMQEGMSLGKMELVKHLDEEISCQEAKGMSVSELTKKIYEKHKREYKSYDFAGFANRKDIYIEKNQPKLDKYSNELKSNDELQREFHKNYETIKAAAFEKICIGWEKFKNDWRPPFAKVA